MRILFFCLALGINFTIHPLTLQRVILASDANPMYLDFWPMVAKAWKQLIGLQPTLLLIADEHVIVDESLGDVIRFAPIPNIETSLQAQVIRLLGPALFPEDGCIISDIDMLPLNKGYYINSAAPYSGDSFVVYRDAAYGGMRFPMCYIAAQGKTFGEIFNIHSIEDIRNTIIEWNAKGYGWNTDEILMFDIVNAWSGYHTRCKRLGHNVTNRIDRAGWGYDVNALRNGYYIDAHMIRPYQAYKAHLDLLLYHLGLQ